MHAAALKDFTHRVLLVTDFASDPKTNNIIYVVISSNEYSIIYEPKTLSWNRPLLNGTLNIITNALCKSVE